VLYSKLLDDCLGLVRQAGDESSSHLATRQSDALARPERQKLRSTLLRRRRPERLCQRILQPSAPVHCIRLHTHQAYMTHFSCTQCVMLVFGCVVLMEGHLSRGPLKCLDLLGFYGGGVVLVLFCESGGGGNRTRVRKPSATASTHAFPGKKWHPPDLPGQARRVLAWFKFRLLLLQAWENGG
jgi:hypothetical protein